MKIYAVNNLIRLMQLFQLIFYRVYLGMQLTDGAPPASVEIKACQIAPTVAVYHSINIHHRVNPKLKVLQKPVNFWVLL
jgi:hypothetical protein